MVLKTHLTTNITNVSLLSRV